MAFTRAAHLAIVLMLPLATLSACKKSICDQSKADAVTFPWDKHLDLVPPDGKVCGARSGAPSSLRVSFPKDENTFVTLVKHLEERGFQRSSQDVKNLDLMFVTLEKDGTVIEGTLHRDDGFLPWAELRMSDAACTGHATDGTSCRRGKRPSPDWIIKCEHDNRVADVSACGERQMCFSNKNPRFGWTGATAICVDSDKL